MLKISVAVLLLIAGVTATDTTCDTPAPLVCPRDNAPGAFPETEEEFKELCKFTIEHLECQVEHEEKCYPDGTDLERASAFLSTFQEICDKDSLIYAAIVDNLKCFTDVEKEGHMQNCAREAMSPSTAQYVESLIENGLIALTDDETESHNERVCIGEIIALSCLGINIEKKCGTLAMDTYIELTQKFFTSTPCAGQIHLLPEIIRIYKLREEEANEISDIFKKKK